MLSICFCMSPVKHLTFPPAAPIAASLPQAESKLKSSALRAGWICLLLGFLTFWIFGFGFLFFSVTIVLAVVAMCTNQVGGGIALLVSSLFSMIICVFIFFALIVGTVGAAAAGAASAIEKQTPPSGRHQQTPGRLMR